MWFWIKILAYGPDFVPLKLDTSDVLHTNRLFLNIGFTDALNGLMELRHTNDTDDAVVDTPNLTWALGAWHMVACTFDKTVHTLNIYVDGVLSATVADAFVYPDLTNSDFTFKYTSAAVETADYIVDEFGLSTKGAITAAQVTALFNANAGMTYPTILTVVPYP
jgi:hypothetical protein